MKRRFVPNFIARMFWKLYLQKRRCIASPLLFCELLYDVEPLTAKGGINVRLWNGGDEASLGARIGSESLLARPVESLIAVGCVKILRWQSLETQFIYVHLEYPTNTSL